MSTKDHLITDVRATTVTVPLAGAAAAQQRHALGTVRPHHRRGRDRRRHHRSRRDGRRRRGRRGGDPGPEALPGRPRPGAHRGAAFPDRQPDRQSSTTTGPSCWRPSSSPASTSSGKRRGPAGPRPARRPGARRGGVRLVPVLPLPGAGRHRGGPHRRPTRRACPGTQGSSTASGSTSSRAGYSRPTTSSSATGRWPPSSPATGCATTPTARLERGDSRSGSPPRSRTWTTTTWRIRPGASAACAGSGQNTRIPLATNTIVVNFEQLAANVLDPAVDVVLLDTTFWGGIRPCVRAAGSLRDIPAGHRRALVR